MDTRKQSRSKRDLEDIRCQILSQMRDEMNDRHMETIKYLRSMKAEISENITTAVMDKLQSMIKQEVERKMKQFVPQIIEETNNKQIITTTQQMNQIQEATKEMTVKMGQQLAVQIYKKVSNEINDQIVPKIDNMVQWVNYNTQDGHEIIDKYRRAAEHGMNRHLQSDTLRITDGKHDKQVISPHVRLVFGDDH